MRLPPLADLHAFALLGETRSLTRVAAMLNVTQPAASKRIRALEEWLGVALVERRANRVALTAAGAEYAAALGQSFRAIAGATDALLRPATGPLRVRAYTTWALRWLIPRLPRFQALQAGLAVEVTTSLEPVDFARDAVDVAVRMGPARHPVAGATRLARHAVAPVARPGVTLAEGPVLFSLARPHDWEFWAAARGVALPERRVAFESTSLAIQAALEGMGVAIASPRFVANELRAGALALLDPEPLETEDWYWLLLAPGRVRPEAAIFSGWLIHEISQE